jgi:hypothetical protein
MWVVDKIWRVRRRTVLPYLGRVLEDIP